ncbi:tetratricopeptide repeat protein [Phormidium sp. CLA17]|uniref:SirB1 family protein n=1 Tax=Leptolyngbya sp. Cla-17 TaxID=2803751 RepID=UPI001492D9A5|nr:transglutaminase-like domain-containing protein [Leptolyngbya sp. Cla-17]MBM0740041.1 tetratricopeptide repeat protein [Leptolyngbya sp. Cla-17]
MDLAGRRLFGEEIQRPDQAINLERAALYIALEEYPDLDVDACIKALDEMAAAVKERLPAELYPLKILKTIQQYLYDDLGYSGNRTEYYDPRNSFLNDVIDRRTGIPITLSMVYLAIARRIGLPMVGINMPGHFLIRPIAEDMEIFVDPFHGGEILFLQDCEELLVKVFNRRVELQPEYLAPVSNRQLLGRLLTNLKVIYINQRNFSKAVQVSERILLVFPDTPLELRDRGVLYYRSDRLAEARQDFERYLELAPLAEDAQFIQGILDEMSE